MTTRNLDALFAPRAVALIGANARPGSVGSVVARNLLSGGFPGTVMLVDAHETEVEGRPVVGRISDLPESPDLAVIATPAETVPQVIGELGLRGCRAAVVISAGFEDRGRPADLRQALLEAARPHLLRIVGPNCLGLLSPGGGLNASFAQTMPPVGSVALISQSGAIAAAAIDWAPAHGLGFSHVITVGDCADVDVADLLDHLASDDATEVILLYLEGVTNARKFMSAARIAARAKPVVVLKAGRSVAGASAALTHTGALAGAAAVHSAAFRRAGLVEVEDLDALLRAGNTFAAYRSCGPRLAVLTNGGGAGVLAVDALETRGHSLVELSPETVAALDAIAPPSWSHRNPVDILGDAHPDLYGRALAVLIAAPEVDAVLVFNAPTAVADSGAAAEAVILAARSHPHKPVLTAWLGGEAANSSRRSFVAAGLSTYESPEAVAEAADQLIDLARRRQVARGQSLHQREPAEPAQGRRIVQAALEAGRKLLTDPEARAVLVSYGIPVIASETVAEPEAAARAAERLSGALALKILSQDISHKSDIGGVRLGLVGADAVREAAISMLAQVRSVQPKARIEGFVLEPMVVRPQAQEMLAGIFTDPTFGPVVLVGEGGIAAEVRADRSLGLPPLDRARARDMIASTRIARLLAGYRGRPPADLDALADVLVALARLAADLPEVAELDINPLFCDAQGAIALDARVGVRRVDATTPQLAILPYPAHLAREVTAGGEHLRIRPVRADDGDRLCEMIEFCTQKDVHLRFGGGLRTLPENLVVRLTELDYDRQMAFAAEDAQGAFLGVGRLAAEPDGRRAEFALLVRSDRQGRGLGRLLLRTVIDYARARGLEEVWGDIARDNDRMLSLARRMGFRGRPDSDVARVVMALKLSHELVKS